MMKYWSLYWLVSKSEDLKESRNPVFLRNRVMKYISTIMIGTWCCYLMFFGVLLRFVLADGPVEGFDIINGGLVFFLLADFIFRLMMAETPAQEMKPYRLLPIPSWFLLNVFMVRRAADALNVMWLFFYVPFGFYDVTHYYGFAGFAGWIIALLLVFVAHSYWYLIWRSLINRNMFYAILPFSLYALVLFFGYADVDVTEMLFAENVQPVYQLCLWGGRWAMLLNPFAFLVPVIAIVLFYYVGYLIQKRMVYYEISEAHESKVKSREMAFFDRFGIIGEYIKLDIKSIMRNAMVRKQFLMGLSAMTLLSVLFAFTGVYDDNVFMQAYCSMYCYCVLAIVLLTNVMCAEGNYMDGLMARRESVLALLRAKYYFNLLVMLIPFLVFMFPVATGKKTFTDSVGCMLFTAGMVLPFLFQMAVYNNQTMSLNARITKTARTGRMQLVVSLAALLVPMVVMYMLLLLAPGYAALIMSVMGVIGIALHPLWLRNVYDRFMLRRYDNMDGFRNTRQ